MERVDSITFHRWFEKSEVVQEVERSILLYLIEKMSGKFDDITTTKNEIVRFLVNQAEKEAKTKNWKN
ncbi:Type I restriction-modification system, restriction subunit R [Geoglobus ahangari]|uniref:Type I restriction-modification system, restriction subunit R n=2 Tax=Geoglobus ahangari TaxID=113653 RepID=A0A0F7DB87_9EURY|nr:Type I restriction-modification system, restriction subunit R [Geoglobus ahangari]